MIIEPKAFKPGDIVTLKMIGGDELVAKLVAVTEDRTYIVNYPHVVMMAQQGFGLMPYVITIDAKTDIEIGMQHVIVIHKTQEAVRKAYYKQTTGLDV